MEKEVIETYTNMNYDSAKTETPNLVTFSQISPGLLW